MFFNLGLGVAGAKRLPPGLIFKAMTPGLIDTIGLSVADYLLVPAAHRSIYYIDSTHMRTAGAIITNIEASTELNDGGELVGSPAKGYAQYADGTAENILRRAYRYFGITWPESFDALTEEQLDALTEEQFDALGA